MDLKLELEGLLGAGVALVQLITYEEDRVDEAVAGLNPDVGVYSWDVADGFDVVRQGKHPCKFTKGAFNVQEALKKIAEEGPHLSLFLMRDYLYCWKPTDKPQIVRKIRNIVPRLRANSQMLVFLTPLRELPAELKNDVTVVEVPLPRAEEIQKLFRGMTKSFGREDRPTPMVERKLVESALGLTLNQARVAFSRAWVKNGGRYNEGAIQPVMDAKRATIRESGALEFWPPVTSKEDVGGLDQMKAWLEKREAAYTEDARQAKLPYPRGVALIGIPGTGKSLTAKMLSALWKLPLLRLDVGAVFASLLGESESNLRKAIQLAETVSPCILWIDEMEKAFAGVGAESGGGAATRVFGSFLTWMQEHTSPVYVLATANDVSALRPELMGRFDRVFFLDLPNDGERREIFLIHLRNAGVDFPERILDLDALVEATRGYVGREIERVVREAQFTAFADEKHKNREIEMRDLLLAVQETVPLSKSHSEIIEQLRKWKTEGRAFPASAEEQPAPLRGGRLTQIL
jgi:hypothetical protein